MVKIITGNIFNSNADAIINTVNCVGVMGKGAVRLRAVRPAKRHGVTRLAEGYACALQSGEAVVHYSATPSAQPCVEFQATLS